MGEQMAELTGALHKALADAIEPLQGDQPFLDLLYASIESNLETLVHIMRYEIPVDEVTSPSAAKEYARRLAQRGISSTALVRAYRLGQQMVLEWAFDELSRREPDTRVAVTAARQINATHVPLRRLDLRAGGARVRVEAGTLAVQPKHGACGRCWKS